MIKYLYSQINKVLDNSNTKVRSGRYILFYIYAKSSRYSYVLYEELNTTKWKIKYCFYFKKIREASRGSSSSKVLQPWISSATYRSLSLHFPCIITYSIWYFSPLVTCSICYNNVLVLIVRIASFSLCIRLITFTLIIFSTNEILNILRYNHKSNLFTLILVSVEAFIP